MLDHVFDVIARVAALATERIVLARHRTHPALCCQSMAREPPAPSSHWSSSPRRREPLAERTWPRQRERQWSRRRRAKPKRKSLCLAQRVLRYTEATWAEDRATRGRDPSADPGAKTGVGGRMPPLPISGIGHKAINPLKTFAAVGERRGEACFLDQTRAGGDEDDNDDTHGYMLSHRAIISC